MEFWYSVRLRRRNVSVRPGFGFAAAASSSDDVNHETMALRASADGCGMLGGGMVPVRSLRTTFSHVSAPSTTLATSIRSSLTPAVSRRSSWQVRQYWSIV